jgi:hypothetical protein
MIPELFLVLRAENRLASFLPAHPCIGYAEPGAILRDGSRLGVTQAVNCQATLTRSLRDKNRLRITIHAARPNSRTRTKRVVSEHPLEAGP